MNKLHFRVLKFKLLFCFCIFVIRCILLLFFRWTFLKIDSLCSKKLQSENGKNL